LITEGLVLAVAAAVAGGLLAWGGLRLLLAVNPDALPRTAEIGLDWRVLLFTLGISIATGIVFGLVPLAHLRRAGVGQTLKDSGSRSATGSARARLRSALVVAEVALAVLLVVGAGLLIRSFLNLTRVDMGFARGSLSTFGVVLPGSRYNADQRIEAFRRVLSEIGALPGVKSVAAASGLPPLRQLNANDTDFEHIPNNRPPGTLPAENVDFYQYVTLGYTDTLGVAVVQGRGFEMADAAGAPVVLINEALARRFFTDRSPLGQHIKPGGDKTPWFTVVGVVKDVKTGGVSEAVGTELYMLADQAPKALGFAPGQMNIVVRSELPLTQLADGFRRVMKDFDPTLPLIRMRSMDEVIDAAIARPRFLTLLLGVFAGLALVLAAVGTYGILSYLVAERRQEIGIRMALGANRSEILRLVLDRGLRLSGLGLLLGLIASAGLTRIMATMLFNVRPIDPLTLAVVTGVMGAVAVVACLVPALRATRVDPLAVLR
jgi:putative ABC transport system permease protein